MRISDWSSDVCSSDLPERRAVPRRSRRSGKSLGAEEAGEGDADAPATTRQRSSRFALHSHEHSPRHRPPTGQALPIYYVRSEEHTSELQSLMRISYAVFCLQKKTTKQHL